MISSEDLDETLSLEDLLQLHLNLDKATRPWTIQTSNLHGRGLFAARGIEEGEIIFRDVALVLGPRSGPTCDPVCVACLSTTTPLRPCSKLCSLPVCSQQCEESAQHAAECGFLREYNNTTQVDDSHSLTNQERNTNIAKDTEKSTEKCNGNKENEKQANDKVDNGSANLKAIVDQSKDIPVIKNINGHCKSVNISDLVEENQIQENFTPGDNCLEENQDNKISEREINNNVVKTCNESKATSNNRPRCCPTEKNTQNYLKNKFPNINGASEGINLELVRTVTPLRCLQMSKLRKVIMKSLESIEHPICEVDILKQHILRRLPMPIETNVRYCCGVLDTNAYGGTGHGKRLNFRGLYALSAIMNHCCTPNTTYWFDNEARMVVKAARKIKQGEEILSTYTSLLWGTATRRSFLNNTKAFRCRCVRCKDRTEYGTFLSGISCKARPCTGVLVPSNPLDVKSDWICSTGAKQHRIGAQKAFQVLNICSKVAEMLILSEDIEQVQKFFKSVPENAQSVVQIRKHFALHAKGSITDYSDVKLQFKEESCVKLLNLIGKLKLGGNYLRGLILQELYFVLQEKNRRSSSENKETMENIRNESEKILSLS